MVTRETILNVLGFRPKRSKRRPKIDHVENLNHGEESDNSTVVVVHPRNASPMARQETRDAKVDTDFDDIHVLAAIQIGERDATIESLKKDLEQERQARIGAENDNEQLSSRLKSIQIKWKRAANELDQIRSKPRDFAPVTDEELKNMVTQLRYNIRSFAIQYFSDRPGHNTVENDPIFAGYIRRHLKLCLKQPETYPALVQAFIWIVLLNQIFDRGRWAGCAAKDYSNIWKRLVLRRAKDDTVSNKDEQELLAWRARTAILVSEELTEDDFSHAEQTKRSIIHEILAVLKLLSDEDYDDEIGNILDDAINVDKVINSQAAKISWNFGTLPGEEDIKDSPPRESGEMMVVFPAMVKQGKSNGEDFDVQSVLLPRVREFCAREKVQEVQEVQKVQEGAPVSIVHSDSDIRQ